MNDLEKYVILDLRTAGWLAPSFSGKGVVEMTVFEALTFAVAFATLMVMVMVQKK